MERSQKKYDFIDTLRGLAILGVILLHTSQIVQPSGWLLGQIANNGQHGVQLFYIASALTLFLSMHSRQQSETAPTRNFFLRRFFRIAPMFYAALAVFFLLDGMSARYWAPYGLRWWYPVSTLLFLHGWYPETIDSVVPGGWSIAVEMTFYLLLPLLFIYLRDIKSTLLYIAIALILGWELNLLMTWVYTPLYPADQQYLVTSFVYFWFFNQAPIFGLGILVYHLFVRARKIRGRAVGPALLWGSLAWLAAIMATNLGDPLIQHHFLMSIGFAGLALGLYFIHPRALVNPVTVWIGKLSYSLYLVHFGMLRVLGAVFPNGFPLQGDLGTAAAFLLVLGCSTLVSYATYRLIERPGIHLGAALVDRLEQSRLQPHPHASQAD